VRKVERGENHGYGWMLNTTLYIRITVVIIARIEISSGYMFSGFSPLFRRARFYDHVPTPDSVFDQGPSSTDYQSDVVC